MVQLSEKLIDMENLSYLVGSVVFYSMGAATSRLQLQTGYLNSGVPSQ